MRQKIRITTTHDGVQLAWARCGSGPPLIKAANWLTHLQYDWESPVWRHWMGFLADHFEFCRFDERGCGMSDRQVEDVSDANWLPDLECVVRSAGIDKPFILLGMSQGAVTAIRYAVAHPEDLSHLILYGGYSRGWSNRDDGQAAHYNAVLDMMRFGWGKENPVFRQAFTQRFIPQATHELVDWFNELCRKTASPEMAVRLLEARNIGDISGLLSRVQVPTLVIHARHDEVVPFVEGQRLASAIPGAEFVALESRNHILLADEPGWAEFRRAVLEFTGTGNGVGNADDSLTRRERQILDLLCRGQTNARIAEALRISEKTVRNHLSSLYRKFGVHSRAEAIVRAYESGEAGSGR